MARRDGPLYNISGAPAGMTDVEAMEIPPPGYLVVTLPQPLAHYSFSRLLSTPMLEHVLVHNCEGLLAPARAAAPPLRPRRQLKPRDEDGGNEKVTREYMDMDMEMGLAGGLGALGDRVPVCAGVVKVDPPHLVRSTCSTRPTRLLSNVFIQVNRSSLQQRPGCKDPVPSPRIYPPPPPPPQGSIVHE